MKLHYPGLAKACRKALAKVLPEIRIVAREHGYAIGLHGSAVRDIDLIAAPWTEDASDTETLVEAIIDACNRTSPWHLAFLNDHDGNGIKNAKPHGRRCWSIHLGGGVYVDLSVMPLLKSE
jgi:hypothetical protein